jgi:hypothetical protein
MNNENYRKERAFLATHKDLTGKRFGKWLVKSISERRRKSGGVVFICVCDCGIKKEVDADSLSSGRSTQCINCKRKEHTKSVCCNGHRALEWGRTPSGSCKGCIKDKSLRSNYGITLNEFLQMYEQQDHKCAICGKELSLVKNAKPGWYKGDEIKGRIEVDHDHDKKFNKIGKRFSVRGLLCGGRWAGCNRKLGRLDKIDWLQSALEYIINPPAHKIIERPQ